LTFKNVRGTQVRLFYRKNNSDGAFTWAVDGVSQGTLTPGGGAPGYGIALATVADGLHTVTVTSPAANAQCGIYGVSGERSSGLIANRFGRPGGQSSIMNDATQQYAYGKPAQLSGANLYPSPSDLAIYAYGVNDAYAGVTADTYFANVWGWLRAQREGATKAGEVDLVILMPHIGTNDDAEPIYYQYAQRLRGLAEHYGAALVNVGARYRQSRAAALAAGYFGSSETSLGLTGTNSVHPSDVGHAAIAAMLRPLVIPGI
jgi:lysophospholipase L1-like esterase